MSAERIYHLALASDWSAAQLAGQYTVSTLGVSLAQEGFIHASTAAQWRGVRDRFYSTVTEPLVLLAIDPALLDSPVVHEPVGDPAEEFPHIYGPINVGAVVETLDAGQ